jgi:hypothetical protein
MRLWSKKNSRRRSIVENGKWAVGRADINRFRVSSKS